MFFNDHAPPHFHASIGGAEALIDIETGETLRGRLPRVAQRLVLEWRSRYAAELKANWDRARKGVREPLERIPGLDADDD
jgi:hypothetical protein